MDLKDQRSATPTIQTGKILKEIPPPRMGKNFPLLLIFTFTLKNVLTIALETAALGSILASSLCMMEGDAARVQFISQLVLIVALVNLLQCAFGIRHCAMQSISYPLLCPVIFYLTQQESCPGYGDLYAMGVGKRSLEWKARIKTIHGCFVVIALIQALFSVEKVQKWLTQVVPPLVLLSCVLFIPVSLKDFVVEESTKNSHVAIGTIFLFAILAYSCKKARVKVNGIKLHILSTFALVISVGAVYLCCALLAYFDRPLLSNDLRAFFDSKLGSQLRMYRYPRLVEFGRPLFSPSALLSIVPLVLVTIPLGQLSHMSANNLVGRKRKSHLRSGSYLDVLSSLLSILLGGVTGFQLNVDSMSDIIESQFWNRFIVFLSSIILLLLSLCSKLCYYITILPTPILGAICAVQCAQYTSFYIKLLTEQQRMLSKRNFFIVGAAMFVTWILKFNPQDPNSYLSLLVHQTSPVFLFVATVTLLHFMISDRANLPSEDGYGPTGTMREVDGHTGFCDTLTCCFSCMV